MWVRIVLILFKKVVVKFIKLSEKEYLVMQRM